MKRSGIWARSMKHIRKLRPTSMILLGFFAVIVLGALLLSLPMSSRTPGTTDFFTALFTAVSAVSVAGLTLVDTYYHWTLFGQGVVLLLIQIGGLGFMSLISIFYFLLKKRIGLRERLMMMESLNLDEMEGVVALVRRVLIGTLLFELVGAIVFSAHFIPEFGVMGGIWRGVFLAVSAFCNAGFHIMGSHQMFSGMDTYAASPAMLLTMAVLIVVGSTGFYVWEDLLKRRRFKSLHLHSKLVLVITGILIALGTMMYFLLESQNPSSIGNLPLGDRILLSLFQSISTRTGGFDVIGQLTLMEDTRMLSIPFMFIGGSSGSAAGGIKTVTVGVLILSAISVLRGSRDLVVFEKRIDQTQIIQAATLASIGLIMALAGSVLLFRTDGVSLSDALFETVSAYSTAGLTIGVLDQVGHLEKTLIMCYMFFGKIGVITLSVAFMMKGHRPPGITYPAEHVIIG